MTKSNFDVSYITKMKETKEQDLDTVEVISGQHK